MVSSTVNTWAVFRFALGYPDERHMERLADLCETVPGTLADLRSLYIDLFEAGLPQPRCPLLESAWLLNRPAGDVVLENQLYYQSFGLEIDGRAAPDHLLTQLEFLAWLDHCEAAGNSGPESLQRRAGRVPGTAPGSLGRQSGHLAHNSDAGCYAELLEALAREVESALN
jgi:nitrate reductase assembly molybdenum cofactor insertion protein NarJ